VEKKTYYVTLDIGTHTGEIREFEEKNDQVFDYEIQATDEEIKRLEDLFDQLGENDQKTFFIAHIPFLNNERKENVMEDQKIQEVYRMIYSLGTEQTKRKMEEARLVH